MAGGKTFRSSWMLGLQSCSAMSNLCSPTQPNIHVSQGCCLRPSRRSQRRATRTRVQRNQRNLRNPKIPRTKKISRRMLDWTLNLICTCSEPQSFGFPKVSAKTVPFATCFNFNVVFSQKKLFPFPESCSSGSVFAMRWLRPGCCKPRSVQMLIYQHGWKLCTLLL